MKIGERLKFLRISKNMQSNELAQRVGISNVYLSYIEHGTKIPTIDTLQKICEALGVSLSEFFSVQDSDLPPEYLETLQNLKVLTPEQLKILNDFLKTLKH